MTENVCIFESDDDRTYGPHNIDRSIADDGYRRMIYGDTGRLGHVSGKAIETCDWLTYCDKATTDEAELLFVKLFEMYAPVRDLAMFGSNDLSKWKEVT